MSITTILDLWMGQDPYLQKRTSSYIRRQLIDYLGTRYLNGTRSLPPKRNLSVQETTNYRLLRYSISGGDKFPISEKDLFIHETTIDQLLDPQTGQPPYLQGLSHPQHNNSSITTVLDRQTTSPFSTKELLVHKTTRKSTTTILEKNDSRQPMTSFIKKATSQPAVK